MAVFILNNPGPSKCLTKACIGDTYPRKEEDFNQKCQHRTKHCVTEGVFLGSSIGCDFND